MSGNPATPLFDLRHVHVMRGETAVLHDISLFIKGGEHVAILGPNGCGKSTLLKTLTCECYPLARPETHLRILGRERWDLTELKKRLGVVSAELPGEPTRRTSGMNAVLTGFFSSSTLWPNLTVTPEMRDRADAALAQVEGQRLRHRRVGEMSAGEQRRIMIARALVASAGTLLLDEPSNALDLAAQRGLRDSLSRLAQAGTGILLITHHTADILPEVNRVLMMREGRIVADGAKHDLLTSSNLSNLFSAEVRLEERAGIFHAW